MSDEGKYSTSLRTSILFLATQRDPRKFPASTAVPVLAFPSSYLKVPNLIREYSGEKAWERGWSWNSSRNVRCGKIGLSQEAYRSEHGKLLFSLHWFSRDLGRHYCWYVLQSNYTRRNAWRSKHGSASAECWLGYYSISGRWTAGWKEYAEQSNLIRGTCSKPN